MIAVSVPGWKLQLTLWMSCLYCFSLRNIPATLLTTPVDAPKSGIPRNGPQNNNNNDNPQGDAETKVKMRATTAGVPWLF